MMTKKAWNTDIQGSDFLASFIPLLEKRIFSSIRQTETSLRDFFIKVNDSKDLSTYSDEPRIFFGKAWLNRKDNYYLVRFDR